MAALLCALMLAVFGCSTKPLVVQPPSPLINTPYSDPAAMQIEWIQTESQVASIRGSYQVVLDSPPSKEVYKIAENPTKWQPNELKKARLIHSKAAQIFSHSASDSMTATRAVTQLATKRQKKTSTAKSSDETSPKKVSQGSQVQESTIFFGLVSFADANRSFDETVLQPIIDSLLTTIQENPDAVIRLLGHASGKDFQTSLDSGTSYVGTVREHILQHAPSATLELFNLGNSMPLTLSNGTKVYDCVEIMAIKKEKI